MYKNSVELIGKLWHPKIQPTKTDVKIWKASISLSKKKDNGEYDTQYFQLVAFGKIAEYCVDFIEKSSVHIEGHLQSSEYMKNDEKRYSTSIIVDRIYLVSFPNKTSSNTTPYTEKDYVNAKEEGVYPVDPNDEIQDALGGV